VNDESEKICQEAVVVQFE